MVSLQLIRHLSVRIRQRQLSGHPYRVAICRRQCPTGRPQLHVIHRVKPQRRPGGYPIVRRHRKTGNGCQCPCRIIRCTWVHILYRYPCGIVSIRIAGIILRSYLNIHQSKVLVNLHHQRIRLLGKGQPRRHYICGQTIAVHRGKIALISAQLIVRPQGEALVIHSGMVSYPQRVEAGHPTVGYSCVP